jgi:hypothetical protein
MTSGNDGVKFKASALYAHGRQTHGALAASLALQGY